MFGATPRTPVEAVRAAARELKAVDWTASDDLTRYATELSDALTGLGWKVVTEKDLPPVIVSITHCDHDQFTREYAAAWARRP